MAGVVVGDLSPKPTLSFSARLELFAEGGAGERKGDDPLEWGENVDVVTFGLGSLWRWIGLVSELGLNSGLGAILGL